MKKIKHVCNGISIFVGFLESAARLRDSANYRFVT